MDSNMKRPASPFEEAGLARRVDFGLRMINGRRDCSLRGSGQAAKIRQAEPLIHDAVLAAELN